MSYIMLLEQEGFAFLTSGENPCDAVERYYNDMYRVAKIPKHSVIAMRILLFVLGVFAAGVWIEQPAEAQSGGWCAYYNYGFGGQRICGFATLQQCLADVGGVGGNCSPSPYYEPPHYPRYRPSYPY